MVGGYLGVLATNPPEQISWTFEIGVAVIPFILFTFFCGTIAAGS